MARLRAAGCVYAEDEARLLGEQASGSRLEDLVRRRIAGEPLEHVLGFVEFRGVRYRVTPGVFVPRQRSVALVDEALRLMSGRALPPVVVDLCCGAGVLGLAVHAECGGDLYAADLDPVATACAASNGVEHCATGDLFEPLPASLRGRVALVLANAPYVPTAALATMPAEARTYEQRAALDGGRDGLDVQRRILADAAAWLEPGGHVLTETSSRQATALAAVATAAGLRARIVADERIDATILRATLPATALPVEPPDQQRRSVKPVE